MRRAPPLRTILIAAAVFGGCEDDPRVTVKDASGRIELTLTGEADRRTSGDKTSWTLRDGPLVVSVQSIPFDQPTAVPRTLSRVRRAVELRFAKELDAAFSSTSCRVAGSKAICFEARHPRGGKATEVMSRQGFLLPVGEHLVLIECAGTLATAARVREQRDLLQSSVRMVGRSS